MIFKRRTVTLILLFFICMATIGMAKDVDSNQKSGQIKLINAWLETKSEHAMIPGLSVSIFDQTGIVWEQAYGHSNAERKTPITPNTPMRVCSVSKLFTALTAMHLDEKGVIDYEKGLQAYLPKFNPSLTGQTTNQTVTFKNVLTHTSGLATEANIPYFIEMVYPTPEQLLEDPNSSQLLAEPNTEFRYSNLAYSLAGLAMSSASGQPYNDLVEEVVIKPLGLKNTHADINAMDLKSSLGRGYGVRKASGREPFKNYSTNALSPAAGLISSSHDLAKLGVWLLNDENLLTDIVPRRTLKTMMEPVWRDTVSENKRGLGFRYYQDGEITYVGHGGYCAGFRAVLLFDPERKMGASVIMNVNDHSPYDLAFSIMQIMQWPITPLPQIDESGLSRYEGIYDRSNMPIRSAIVAGANQLLVMDLFADRPEGSILILEPLKDLKGHFKKVGEPIEGSVFFTSSGTNESMRFNRYYNYLTRIKAFK